MIANGTEKGGAPRSTKLAADPGDKAAWLWPGLGRPLASQSIATAILMEFAMKKTTKTPTTPSAPPDVNAILQAATIEEVPIGNINMDDSQFKRRERIEPACKADDINVDNGVVDMSGDHPVVLRENGECFQIVNGFRRLAVLKSMNTVTTVRCRVIRSQKKREANFLAKFLANRINLSHGLQLAVSERKLAFNADYRAHKAAGYKDLSFGEWGRIYCVSTTTISASWIPFAEGKSRSAKKKKDLQIGGHQQDSPASPAEPNAETEANDSDTNDSGGNDSGANDGGASKSTALTVVSNTSAGCAPKSAPNLGIEDVTGILKSAVDRACQRLNGCDLTREDLKLLCQVIQPLLDIRDRTEEKLMQQESAQPADANQEHQLEATAA